MARGAERHILIFVWNTDKMRNKLNQQILQLRKNSKRLESAASAIILLKLSLCYQEGQLLHPNKISQAGCIKNQKRIDPVEHTVDV